MGLFVCFGGLAILVFEHHMSHVTGFSPVVTFQIFLLSAAVKPGSTIC